MSKGKKQSVTAVADDVLETQAKAEPAWRRAGHPLIDVTHVGAEKVNEVWRAIRDLTEDPPTLYRSGEWLHLYRQARNGEPARIEPAHVDNLRSWLKRFDFSKVSRNKDVPTTPPDVLLKLLLHDTDPEHDVPKVVGIVDLPPIQRDGTVNPALGYQKQTGHIYIPASEWTDLRVEARPEHRHVEAARSIIHGVLHEFPFADRASYTNAVALMLTAGVRHLVDGNVPAFAITAPVPGSGKGLLKNVLLYPMHGQEGLAEGVLPENDAEFRKNITSKLLARSRLFVIDNVGTRVDSSVLANAITSRVYSDRILGGNREVKLAQDLLFVLTGNNEFRYSAEIARRVVPIRLEPPTGSPERQQFTNPDLLGYVRGHRPHLVWAIQTLVRYWVVQGRPGPGREVPRKGSFNEWRRMIGGVLRAADYEDFLGNDVEVQEDADDREGEYARFVAAWRTEHGSKPVKAADLLKAAEVADLWFPPESKPVKILEHRLGLLKGRIFDGFKVTYHRGEKGRWWKLVWAGEKGQEPPRAEPVAEDDYSDAPV